MQHYDYQREGNAPRTIDRLRPVALTEDVRVALYNSVTINLPLT